MVFPLQMQKMLLPCGLPPEREDDWNDFWDSGWLMEAGNWTCSDVLENSAMPVPCCYRSSSHSRFDICV